MLIAILLKILINRFLLITLADNPPVFYRIIDNV